MPNCCYKLVLLWLKRVLDSTLGYVNTAECLIEIRLELNVINESANLHMRFGMSCPLFPRWQNTIAELTGP